MNIAILGSGMVGQTLAGKLVAIGHEVALGTRDPEATKARTDPGPFGQPSFSDWYAENPRVNVETFADAAADAEVVMLAANGQTALLTLEGAGKENLDGKILIDVSNPLDFSNGFPPSLSVCNTTSLGEQIQQAYPDARVVKTLNTVSAPVMIEPGAVADGDHTLFVCGDDADAKQAVTGYMNEWFGWKDVLDLGDITNARGTEGYLLLWTRVFGATQTPLYNVKVVR